MTDQRCLKKVYICFLCTCWPCVTNHYYPFTLVFLLFFLLLVFFDLLQGSHQSFGCRAFAQPLGCCCSDGRCSILKPAGPPSSCFCTSPTPSSPLARPTSQPRHPETRPWAHSHHPWANPLLSLLTHHRVTSASQEHSLQKHTVKLQKWSTNSNS